MNYVCLQNDKFLHSIYLCIIKLNKYLPGENLFFIGDLQVFSVNKQHFCWTNKSKHWTLLLLKFKVFLLYNKLIGFQNIFTEPLLQNIRFKKYQKYLLLYLFLVTEFQYTPWKNSFKITVI